MKIILLIAALLTVAVAQEEAYISCFYQLYEEYGCNLEINNRDGLNNFTEIRGIHLEGYTNADVRVIYAFEGVSINVPRIICDTFPNLSALTFFALGVTELGDSDFSGCSRLATLDLTANNIYSISPNAFSSLSELYFLSLYSNWLSTLPENLFANQRNLTVLTLSFNNFVDLPVGIFRPLESLQNLHMDYANLSTINSQWFGTHPDLTVLYLIGNRINLTPDIFVGLESVDYLDLGFNGLNEIPAGVFARLQNLYSLFLYGNNFVEFREDSFAEIPQLLHLELSQNPIEEIHGGAFRSLENLNYLSFTLCQLRTLHSNSFEGLRSIDDLHLSFNNLDELPEGIFVPMPNLSELGLWGNRLKTLHRNRFGSLANLELLDLDGNIVNAIDRPIIDEAVNLDTLYLGGNLCASGYFNNFRISRAQYLPMLDRCFRNFRYIVDTTTEADDQFSFFEGPEPGIALRVNTGNEVQIALTPFDFVWNPVIEILIGAENNTRSIIRMNQDTDVVTVPTPNIVAPDQWNDFRVTWANQNVLVFRSNDTFPFMGFTMQDFFPVNFYGLRAVGTRASWSVQPFEW